MSLPLPKSSTLCRRVLALAALGCASLLAHAGESSDDASADDAAISASAFSSVEWTQTAVPNVTAPLSADERLLTTRNELWWRQQKLLFGLSTEGESPAPTAAAAADRQPQRVRSLHLGVGLATGERSRITWEVPVSAVARATATPGSDAVATRSPADTRAQEMRLTLALHSAPSGLAELRRGGLFKLSLSSQTQMSLRLRGGRLGVALQSRW